MEYIILAAGMGSRLYPYSKNSPKCLVKVSQDETVIERSVRLIKKYDKEANIHIVIGFQANQIRETIGNSCNYIFNPFYKITNSIASLWFAKEVLLKEKDLVIINGDIVFSQELAIEICRKPESSIIYYDSSIKEHGDYNVQIMDGNMVVMGKELSQYDGEYVGITKYTKADLPLLISEVTQMINDELYDQWYENGLVQISLNNNHKFRAKDICDHHWSEIDSIDNLLKIRTIMKKENS